ncbi:MAG: hypothetical protein AVDCRST_MAG19-3848, partial [uncultured Thermomicrobiales bacterium]
ERRYGPPARQRRPSLHRASSISSTPARVTDRPRGVQGARPALGGRAGRRHDPPPRDQTLRPDRTPHARRPRRPRRRAPRFRARHLPRRGPGGRDDRRRGDLAGLGAGCQAAGRRGAQRGARPPSRAAERAGLAAPSGPRVPRRVHRRPVLARGVGRRARRRAVHGGVRAVGGRGGSVRPHACRRPPHVRGRGESEHAGPYGRVPRPRVRAWGARRRDRLGAGAVRAPVPRPRRHLRHARGGAGVPCGPCRPRGAAGRRGVRGGAPARASLRGGALRLVVAGIVAPRPPRLEPSGPGADGADGRGRSGSGSGSV